MPARVSTIALVLATLPAAAAAQTRTVSGTVLPGDARTPFAGAEVTFIGGSASTCVDGRGNFALDVPVGEARLRITPVGFAAQEVVVAAGADTVEVALGDHVIILDGVEVVGIAASLAAQMAPASSAKLDARDLERVPASTVEGAMQGKVVGAQIERNSGAPGGGYSIHLRGVNTILGVSDPLVVVDGSVISNVTIPTGAAAILRGGVASENAPGRLADLNPNDIERIELLRGAAAAAQYGSRASNGVIVITTKRGGPPERAPSHTALRCFLPR
jgi:TonB-dependent SusC/RagA subfamily outer membrane receptor